jgi:leader peptidase (prepilin peptidase)/N-methyltransferase
MRIIFYLIVFLFGLSVGSFLNCVIYRLEKKKSFLKGRSFCPHCKHILNWQDLIPLFSFLFLKGKCRYCQKKISPQYPLVELATGLLFVLTTHYSLLTINYQSLLFTIYRLLPVCFLIVIFVYDLKHYIIPNKVIYPAIIIALIFNFQFSIFNYSILSALGAALFFLLIVLVSRGKWMGLGDVKLALFIGLFLGYPDILVALFLSFLIGAIIGVGLISAGKKTLRSEVPFGPFLVIGTFISMFWGESLINWYLNLFKI